MQDYRAPFCFQLSSPKGNRAQATLPTGRWRPPPLSYDLTQQYLPNNSINSPTQVSVKSNKRSRKNDLIPYLDVYEKFNGNDRAYFFDKSFESTAVAWIEGKPSESLDSQGSRASDLPARRSAIRRGFRRD